MRILHLSDLHFQIDWRSRSFLSTGLQGILGRIELHAMGRQKRFMRVKAQIEQALDDAHALSVDQIVVTGDLTALGHDDEFYAVAEILSPLIEAGKVTIIPGNHDRYLRSINSVGFERIFSSVLKSELPEYAVLGGYPFVHFVGERLALVGIDSTQVRGWGHYFWGRIGAPQLDALRRLLSDPRMQKRTVVLLSHHGPIGLSGTLNRWHTELVDGVALNQLAHEHHAVILHGHLHQRLWHRAQHHHPHVIGGGSSTELGNEGYWTIDLDDHLTIEARHLGFGRVEQ